MILENSMGFIKSSVTFLMVPPKDGFALMLILQPYQLTYFYPLAINIILNFTYHWFKINFLKTKYIITQTIQVDKLW